MVKSMPSRTKYRKAQKGGKKLKGNAGSGYKIAFGDFALKVLTSGRLRAKQIEAARRCITRAMKRTGKMWIRVFPHIPVTGKPAEVRMGKGKGSVDYWMCKLKPGHIIFEVSGVDEATAIDALEKAGAKLPFRFKIVKRVN
jgi:large subunit ribosomal protein L16